jgi:3-deoxy-D-manno-octulosonic acid (KDO) 8-phosphate synthase
VISTVNVKIIQIDNDKPFIIFGDINVLESSDLASNI